MYLKENRLVFELVSIDLVSESSIKVTEGSGSSMGVTLEDDQFREEYVV